MSLIAVKSPMITILEDAAKKAGLNVHVKESMVVRAHFVEGSYDSQKRTFDCIIITEGLGNKRDKHFYLRETIKQAVADKIFEGEQCYADHPSKIDDQTRPERSIRDLAGYFMESTYLEVPDKINPGQMLGAYGAKLKISEGADWVVGLIKESIEFNKRFPNKSFVGISINADGDTVPHSRGNLGEVNDVTKITGAFSADIVTKPARQGGFLKLVEGAFGASSHIYPKGQGMATQAQLLEAAKKLEEAQKGKEIDPAFLGEVVALLKEAKIVEAKTDKNKTDAEKADAEDATDDGADEGDENADGTKKKKMMMDEAAKKKQESASTGKGNLNESDAELKAKYPSLFAAALREAQKVNGDSTDERTSAILKENAELRAQHDLRESSDIAKKLLRESKIPEGAFARTLSAMIGHTESEMKDILVNEERFLESIGYKHEAKRVEGNGERANVNIRESDSTKRTNALLDGVTEA